MLLYHHYIQLASLLVQVVLIKKNWPSWFRLVLMLTCLSCGVELSGEIISHGFHKINAWLYNIYTPIQGFLILFTFPAIIQTNKLKATSKNLILIYLSLTVVNYFMHPGGIYNFNDKAVIISLICNVIAVSLYYMDTMRNDITITLSKQPSFYFATAILLMSVLFICRFAFWNILKSMHDYQQILTIVIILANTFMYGGFIAVFICQKRYHTK